MTGDADGPSGANAESPIPIFEFPEAAARSLGRIAAYAVWRRQPLGKIPAVASTCPHAREFIRGVMRERGPGWLGAAEARQLLTIAGLSVPPGGLARDEAQAVELAERIGFPVTAKLASRTIVHKSDIGGVRLDLADAAAVRAAFRSIAAAVASSASPDAFDGVLVQPMIREAVEVVAGMTQDRQFGPLLMFGLGGVHVEILGDVVFRITPLTDRDAAEMIRSIRGYRLLQGYRGHPRCDIAALEDLLLRLSGLVESVPEIAEMDLNPVMALADGRGCFIADVRVRIDEP
jgi:acyl-CoA synthetase (NDP forming)